MSDTDKPPDDIPREPVFYYSREHRLSMASPNVRAMNEGEAPKRGLTKSLFGSKSNMVLFVTIMLIVASFTLTSRFSKKEQSVKLGGNTVAIVVLQQEGALFLSILKKAPQSGEFYTGAVELSVSPAVPKAEEGKARESFRHRIVFNITESEAYRILLPFDAGDFLVALGTADEQKTLRVKLKKNEK